MAGPLTLLSYLLPVLLFAVAGAMYALNPGHERWRHIVRVSAFMTLAQISVFYVLWSFSYLSAVRYDQYIFCIDQVFGSPSFHVGRLLKQTPWLNTPCRAAYSLISVYVFALLVVYFWERSRVDDALQAMWVFVLNATLAPVVYLLIPVSGPHYAFPGFPDIIPAHITPHPIVLSAVPNCIPSVHMSTALLILHFSRWSKIAMALAFFNLVLIVLATLGTGEHYLFDLIVAVPYAALMIYLGGATRAQSHLVELTPAESVAELGL